MKKGFTLVELLAVIVILALLATIAVPSAISISHSIKEDMYCTKVDMIISAAKTWGSEHMSQLRNTSQTTCYKEMTVGELISKGAIKKESETEGEYLKNPVTDEPMDNQKIGLYIMNKRVQAFFIEENPDLQNVCEGVKVCSTPSETDCVHRPPNKCS